MQTQRTPDRTDVEYLVGEAQRAMNANSDCRREVSARYGWPDALGAWRRGRIGDCLMASIARNVIAASAKAPNPQPSTLNPQP